MSVRKSHAPRGDAHRRVCRCNGVTRAEVLEAIDDGCETVQQIAATTSAGASCGSCRKQLSQLLARRGVGCDDAMRLCGCTELDHETVREEIRNGEFDSVAAVMKGLGWSSPDGCARCRPALNYYLLCERPDSYQDDPQSRVANERNHANLQRDGSYSVVPRLFGGVVTPAQLRAIADAAERFDVPLVKLTGAQRIDLVGVRGNDLPELWETLGRAGLVSGHAYARGVRNVKTCVGDRFCRYGLADSVGLGVEVEELTWNCWTPHKVKLAVSACARNCAEATIKDIGAVAVEGGWDIYIGGSAGMRVRPGRRLTRVTGERELLEHVAAFLQLYREEGHYGERTGSFVERVGLDYAKERLVDDPQGRGVLFRRFYRSQRGRQTDPWETAAKARRSDLVPIARLTGALS